MNAGAILRELGLSHMLEKRAATALVRMLQKGLLSPAATQRAAAAMRPGTFRTVANLGRGQFSLADKVVGNVGGHAGEMVRKLPTRLVASPMAEYGPAASATAKLNAAHTPAGGVPPLAPYAAVTPRGAFQHMATGKPDASSLKQVRGELDDLHSANVGPKGQIFDFWHKDAPLAFHGRSISPAIKQDGADVFGNMDAQVLGGSTLAAEQLQHLRGVSNNNVRQYWATPVSSRPALQAQLAARPALDTAADKLLAIRSEEMFGPSRRAPLLATGHDQVARARPVLSGEATLPPLQAGGTGTVTGPQLQVSPGATVALQPARSAFRGFGLSDDFPTSRRPAPLIGQPPRPSSLQHVRNGLAASVPVLGATAGSLGYYGQQQQAAESESRYLDMRQQQLAESRRLSGQIGQ